MKASSRYKKQPAFDPSELEDLIHSPAVGSGVSSHLIRAHEAFPALAGVPSVSSEEPDTTQTIGTQTTGAALSAVPSVLETLQDPGLETTGSETTGLRPRECSDADVSTATSQTIGSETTGLLPRSAVGPVVAKMAFSQTTGLSAPPVVVRYYGKPCVRLATTAQDGHSQIEEAIYRILWNKGVEVTEATRESQAGYMELAALTHLSQASIKRGLKSLQTKLAIEVKETYSRELNTAKTYRVYSYRSILKRRDDAGLKYVIRNRGGVELTGSPLVSDPLVNDWPLVNDPMVSKPVFHSPLVSDPLVNKPTAGSQTIGPMVSQTTGPMVYESPYPYSLIRKLRNNDDDVVENPPPVENLERLIRSERPLFDGVARLWRQSREVIPDCTVQEVNTAFHWKAAELDRNRGLQNFNGALLEAWPGFFTPVLIDFMRKQSTAAPPRQESNREEWLRRLDDPQTGETERKLLKQWLDG